MENIPNLLQNFASLVNLFYFKVVWILLLKIKGEIYCIESLSDVHVQIAKGRGCTALSCCVKQALRVWGSVQILASIVEICRKTLFKVTFSESSSCMA